MYAKVKKTIIVCLAIMSVFLSSCEDKNQLRIPNAPVFLKLNLTTEYPTFRNNVNDTLIFVRPRIAHQREDYLGFGGVLVVVGIGENGTKYYAYDLACPYEAKSTIRIYPQADGTAKCNVCGSEFYLTDGWGRVSKSPSKWSLKRYSVDYIHTGATEFLLIKN